MPKERSFTEYIFSTRFNEMFSAVRNYVYSNREALELYSQVVENVSYAELSDIEVVSVSADERSENVIAFDIIIDAEIEIKGKGSRDWETDICSKWFMLSCMGTLTAGLSDFKILKIEPFNQKNYMANPLSDSLVPYIRKEELDDVATEFLRKYYPEALETPMPLDTALLAKRMGLEIVTQQLTEDFTAFGQIFFADADSDVYDINSRKMTSRHFKAGTIVVDPQTFLLRNLGSVHNTVVHECVHWDRHRKAFELERLYNSSATQIQCIVVGGVKSETNRTANDWMEWQANVLTPRIQMPIMTFKIKANEFVRKHKKLCNTNELVDVMQPVIDDLAEFFSVSRTAAKIRMVDVGYEEAVGAFTYIDGQYIKPYGFKKGSISKKQTYSISLEDAMYATLLDPHLCPHTLKGDFIYVDSHVCVNNPKYVLRNGEGKFDMTEYGRLHVDECCLAFDLKVKHASKYSERFYKECVLYRDVNSGLHFEAEFSPESSKNITEKASAVSALYDNMTDLLVTLPKVFSTSLIKIMDWIEISVEELAEKAKLSDKTIQRLRTRDDYNIPLKTVIALCISMHLPPLVSQHLIDSAGVGFKYTNKEHMLYHFFITSYYCHTIDECNEMLHAQGFKSLSGDE